MAYMIFVTDGDDEEIARGTLDSAREALDSMQEEIDSPFHETKPHDSDDDEDYDEITQEMIDEYEGHGPGFDDYEEGFFRYRGNYCPSAENGDYSPSCPWNAPGMSIRDFI